MKPGAIRRPVSGASIIEGGIPGVPLRYTPGCNPSHPADALILRTTTAPLRGTSDLPRQEEGRWVKAFNSAAAVALCSVWLRNRAPEARRIKGFYSTAAVALGSVWLRDRAPEARRIKGFYSTAAVALGSVRLRDRAPEARRIKARSEAQRNSGTDFTTISQAPDKGWRRMPRHRWRSSNGKPCARKMTLNSSRNETVR
jgi:hypothetical protein